MSEPELVWDVGAELGEGPVWDAALRAVWYVDINGRKLHRYGLDDGAKIFWETPDQTGFAPPRTAPWSAAYVAASAGSTRIGAPAT